jgi:hypothetical protein
LTSRSGAKAAYRGRAKDCSLRRRVRKPASSSPWRARRLFGLASSTLLTVLVIPAIYVVLRNDGRPLAEPQDAAPGKPV